MAGNLIIISAPSGTGKTTLVKEIQQRLHDIRASISYTSRPARTDEVNGKHYQFVTRQKFKYMITGEEFLEWAEVHGNLYGTSRETVQQMLNEGMDVILTIDVQGAAKTRRIFPDAISIFVLPPSYDALAERLDKRGSTQAEDLRLRMGNAQRELMQYVEYDYLIINDELEYAVREFEAIIVAARCRRTRRAETAEFMLKSFRLD